MYELEFIESSKGVYPSTEGFLRLLRTLFETAGSPKDLGHRWRVRSGCTPYIEYVKNLVLARTMGTFPDCDALPFRSQQDRMRLVSLALQVIEATVTRYQIPSDLSSIAFGPVTDERKNHKVLTESATEVVGSISLVKHIVQQPRFEDAQLFAADWRMPPAERGVTGDEAEIFPSDDRFPLVSSQLASGPAAPRTKSPALSVLVDLLQASGGQLFRSIVTLLGSLSVPSKRASESDKQSLAFALFGSTLPTINIAKLGTKRTSGPPSPRILLPLQDDHELLSFSKAVEWEESAIVLSLNILCAALVREAQLQAAVFATPGARTLVPALSFRKRGNITASPEMSSLQLGKLSHLLITSSIYSDVVCRIVNLVGYNASDDLVDADIARAAIPLVFNIDMGIDNSDGIASCYRSAESGLLEIGGAFGSRLVRSTLRVTNTADSEVSRVVLNRILVDLRQNSCVRSISALLLGSAPDFPENRGVTKPIRRLTCIDALLHILEDSSFVADLHNHGLAACVFEIFARLMHPNNCGSHRRYNAFHIASRLRSIDFWRKHLTTLVRHLESSTTNQNDQVIHSLAWLLKGIANEIHLLRGGSDSVQFDMLMEFLFADSPFIMESIVRSLPILPSDDIRCPLSAAPSEEALKKSRRRVSCATDVVEVFELVDLDALREFYSMEEDTFKVDQIIALCVSWNSSIIRAHATEHLSFAIRCVLGTTTTVDTSILSRLPACRIWWSKLLAVLLGRMAASCKNQALLPTTIRNLSAAALMIANSLSQGSCESDDDASYGIAPSLSMAATAVVCSIGPLDRVGSLRLRKDSTAILGAVWSLLLEIVPGAEGSWDDLRIDDVAAALVHLACPSSDDPRPPAPTNTALLARGCLCLVFNNVQCFQDDEILTFFRRFLFQPHGGSTVVESLLRCLVNLDWNIGHFLQYVATFPQLHQILLAANVLGALYDASEVFKHEESIQSPKAAESAFGTVEIGLPSFLTGHLELMLTLMASCQNPESGVDVSARCTKILLNYERILDGVLVNFPKNCDLVQLVVRCFCLSKALSRSRRQDSSLSSTEVIRNEICRMDVASLAEHRMISLAFHVASHPLPLHFLPELPTGLIESSDSQHLVVSPVKSWWDSWANFDRSDSSSIQAHLHSVDFWACAVLAANITRSCLWAYRTQVLSPKFDTSLLARGLCRCCDAFKVLYMCRLRSFIVVV